MQKNLLLLSKQEAKVYKWMRLFAEKHLRFPISDEVAVRFKFTRERANQILESMAKHGVIVRVSRIAWRWGDKR